MTDFHRLDHTHEDKIDYWFITSKQKIVLDYYGEGYNVPAKFCVGCGIKLLPLVVQQFGEEILSQTLLEEYKNGNV